MVAMEVIWKKQIENKSYAAVLADIEKDCGSSEGRSHRNCPNGLSLTNLAVVLRRRMAIARCMGPCREKVAVGDPLALVKVGDFKRVLDGGRVNFSVELGKPKILPTILNAMRKTRFPMKGENPGSSLYSFEAT